MTNTPNTPNATSGTGKNRAARRFKFDIRAASRPILILLALWLVVSVGFYFGWTRPKVRAAAEMSGASVQGSALEERTAVVQRHEDFLAALEQAQSDLAYLRNDVLSTKKQRLVEVQQELARLCEQFNIPLDSVSYSNDILPDEELERLAMIVPLEGGYGNLRKFLQAVEDSTKFLLVERVALAEGKQGGVMLQLDITLTTYFDLPPEMKRRNTRKG